MNEIKILDLLEKIYVEVQETKSDINILKTEVKSLHDGQTRIEIKLDNLDNKINELEPLNTKRHIEIGSKIDRLSTDLNVVEAISGKNLADIAMLKIAK